MSLLQIVVTSPRVAPGLLSVEAWDAVRGADHVVAPDLDAPTVRAVRAAGVDVVVGGPAPAGEGTTVWIAPADGSDWASGLASALVVGDGAGPDVEVVHGSWDLPGARVLDLVEVMDQLRRRCPWTQEQTHDSLVRYLLEETHEVLEALDEQDGDHLREELGDLLMQVVFHARIAEDAPGDEAWTVDDVADGIVAKLVERNPHVFGDVEVADAAEVDANWQAIKAAGRVRRSPVDGIPATLPALALADKVLERAERDGPLDLAAPGGPEGVGHRLLALVQDARRHGVDAEQELRRAVADAFG
ncbi:MazG family protein [Solicola sp. PLA-1-18]|uniref:MazG family protein n=1 Tax=Solicola sp. PLA-1-18 TaxID=3380532 RepID=UPI003B81469F